MRRVLITLLFCFSLEFDGAVAQTGAPQITKLEVADSVYSIAVALDGNPVGAMMYVVQSDAGMLLLDANLRHPQLSQFLAGTVASLGEGSVRFIVVSHWHPDHSGGAGCAWRRSGPGRASPTASPTCTDYTRCGPNRVPVRTSWHPPSRRQNYLR